MKYLTYIQMYILTSIVSSDGKDMNMISDGETDCSSSEIYITTRKLDIKGKNSLDIPRPKVDVASKDRRQKNKRRRKGTGLAIPTTDFDNNLTVVDQMYDVITPILDSLEQEQNTTVQYTISVGNVTETTTAVVKEYIEEFTKATTQLVTNTTIAAVTWGYQGNKSSEESDESKSTLIDYPFSVSIQKKGAHYASGALLNKFWVITAAGEFYNVRESLKLFRVRLGSVDCKSGGIVIPLKKIEIHPYYVYGKPNFDVALLRMAMYVDYSSFIRPIVISNIKGKVLSAKFMTTYWPRILVKGTILPQYASERVRFNSMRVSTQRLIPDKQCNEILRNLSVIMNESTLCLKPVVTHHTICTPDVGAPVLAEDGLWGITSGWISPLCPMLTGPTLFTRLSSTSVRSWLDSHLQTLH